MNRVEHLLTILAEECAETAHRVSKALRFGLDEVQPDQPLSNAERIIYEFTDILAVIEMLREEGHLPKNTILVHQIEIQSKKDKIEKYLEHSKKVGTLQD